MFLAFFAANAWGQKITTLAGITSGSKYYIGATTSSNDYYFYVDGSAKTESTKGVAYGNKEAAVALKFTAVEGGWTIQFDNGNYLGLKNSKDNGAVQVVEEAVTWTIEEDADKGLLKLHPNDYYLQKNNSGTQFGSYKNTQTNVWLEYAGTPTPTRILRSIYIAGTATCLEYSEGEEFDPAGLKVMGKYDTGDDTEITKGITWSFDPETLALGTTSVEVTANVYDLTSPVFTVSGLTVKELIYANTYTSNVVLTTTGGTSASTAKVIWKEKTYDAIKAGTGKAQGACKVTIPANTKTLHFHAAGWNGESVKLSVNGTEYTLKADAGVTNNSPFTLQNDPEEYDYFTFEPNGATTITFTATEGNRFVLFGVNAELGTAPQKTLSSIAVKTAPAKTAYVVGETFDPTGLVLTATYSDATTADIAYADHKSEFSFTPALDAALAVSDESVTITYGEKSVAQTITVSADAPAYDSLADLVAAGAPTTTGRKVTVTLTDEEIQSIYVTQKGYRNGIILQVGEQEVEIFSYDVPEEWVEGGTVSGTLTNCDWKLFGSTWELCPADWKELTYTAPAASAVLESIAITGTPVKTDYQCGASFSTAGLTVTAYYDDESTRDVTADVTWTIDPEVFTETGDNVQVNVTAKYDEEDAPIYVTDDATYYVTVAEKPNYVFYESFDENEGTGGNDGEWSGAIASKDIKYDNEGWNASSVNGADQCAKLGSGSKKGSATTPTINYTGDLMLTFKAAAWNGGSEKTALTLSTSENAKIYTTSVEMQKGAWTTYTVYIKADGEFTLTFAAKLTSNNRFFLDEVMLMAAPAEAITISDKALDDASGNYYGTYYTALTFAVPTGLHCATVSVDGEDHLVVNEFAADAIVPANTGLLVWAAEAGTYDIALASSPNNTTVTDNCLYGSLEAAEAVAPTADAYEFFKLTKPEGENLGFWWGAADGAAFVNGAHKAYLALPAAVAAKVKGFALSDLTTAVRTATASAADAAIYDLQGRRVSNAQRGTLYIQGGKKYIK